MVQAFAFIEFYAAPLIFAVGLYFFIYGIVSYFIIGPGYEIGWLEKGRQQLLWATFLFFVGLVLFLSAGWLLDFVERFSVDDRAGVQVEQDQNILVVPDVPGS